MTVQNYLDKMKTIQHTLLEFIESENLEENYENLIGVFKDQIILGNPNELKSVLYLIVKIANNHCRSPYFFQKIGKILLYFKDDAKKYYSNYEIFNIFKSNKRILLFLIKEDFIIMDRSITYTITNDKYKEANYQHYFSPEIKPFINQNSNKKDSIQLPENFEELRKEGENDNHICKLIRKDSVEEFIEFVKKTKFQLDATIEPSIFETNPFFIKNEPTLIEYAAFFGSINIFKYLIHNEVRLTPFLWIYAVHGQNLELIHLLEEYHVVPKDDCEDCIKECIKCHHNDIEKYIKNNFLQNKDDYNDMNTFSTGLKFYNFAFIDKESINESSFYDLCQYDYFTLVEILLKNSDIDINSKIILKIRYFNSVSK